MVLGLGLKMKERLREGVVKEGGIGTVTRTGTETGTGTGLGAEGLPLPPEVASRRTSCE